MAQVAVGQNVPIGKPCRLGQSVPLGEPPSHPCLVTPNGSIGNGCRLTQTGLPGRLARQVKASRSAIGAGACRLH